jgi:hypothetical protein
MQLEQEAKEWIKKRGTKKPPKRVDKYGDYLITVTNRVLLAHFYILYILIFLLFIFK